MRLTPRYCQNVSKVLDFYSQFNPSPLSIKQFIDFGLNACEKRSYAFLRKEIPVRLANIIKEIGLLPENLLKMPSVKAVNNWYMQSFREILEFENISDNQNNLNHFCDSLVKIRNRHSDVVETMAQGVLELKESYDVDHHTEHSIQYFLDRFFMSRISIRMLINQHTMLFGGQLESAPGPNQKKYIGCIDPHCNIVSVIKDAYENARHLCDQYYLSSPELEINQYRPRELDKNELACHIMYVPSHLYHILFELFKNAMRAVVEYHGSSEPYPSISVTISQGKEDICLKMSDKGGGIPRSLHDQLFKYMYSTAPQPSKSDIHSVPIAGYGYGLPISRLYARYFHGDLCIMSCENYGTDAVVYMKALSNEANELLPIFNKSTSKAYRTFIPTGDWTNQANLHNGRHKLQRESVSTAA